MRFRLQTAPPLPTPGQYMYGVPEADPLSNGLAHPGATILDLLKDIQSRLPGLTDEVLYLSLNGFQLLENQPFRTLISQDELLTLSALPRQKEDAFSTPKTTKTLLTPLQETATPLKSPAKSLKRPRETTTEKTAGQPRCSVCRLRGHFRKVCPSVAAKSTGQEQETQEERREASPIRERIAQGEEEEPRREASPIRERIAHGEEKEPTSCSKAQKDAAPIVIPSAYRHKKKLHNVTQHQKSKAAPHERFTQELPSPAASPISSHPMTDTSAGPMLHRPIQFEMLHLSPNYEPEIKVFRGKVIHFDPATDTAELLLDDGVLAEPAPVYDEEGERVWRKFELPSEETEQRKNVMQLFWSDVHQVTYLSE